MQSRSLSSACHSFHSLRGIFCFLPFVSYSLSSRFLSLQSVCLVFYTCNTHKHTFLWFVPYHVIPFYLSQVYFYFPTPSVSLHLTTLICSISVITFLLTYYNFLSSPFPFSCFPFPFLHLILQAKTSWGRPLSSCTQTGQTETMGTCEGRPC